MNTAIIINLDYEGLPVTTCQEVWQSIETHMREAGFVKNNRLFLTNMNQTTAFSQARAVVDTVENEFLAQGVSVLQALREFYGIPYQEIVNLATPSDEGIEVQFSDTGTFKKFFG